MLDLDASVHLEEVEIAIGVGQELDRAGAEVVDRLRRLHRDLAHRVAHLGRNERRRRFLDHLLMAALDRAFALEHMDRVALLVGEHLHFDMARPAHELLDVETPVAERRLGLARHGADDRSQILVALDQAQALAAAAGRRLEHDRKSDLFRDLAHLRFGFERVRRARNDGHAGRRHQLARLDLVAHPLDRLGRTDR